jgi:hypothetical protein
MRPETFEVPLRLHADDAVEVAVLLSQLAALIDIDDPDVSPAEVAELTEAQLTATQIRLLNPVAKYRDVERDSVAQELRRLAATLTGQLYPAT